VYVSYGDVQVIARHCPAWFQDLIWMAYYSEMREDLEKEIMRHQTRAKSVSERYGRVSDDELLNAIDSMVFTNCDTEILVARERPESNDNPMITKTPEKKKGHRVRDLTSWNLW